MVGYDSSNIYRIWNPITNKIIRTRDVVFDESKRYSLDDLPQSEPEIIEHIDLNPVMEFRNPGLADFDSEEFVKIDLSYKESTATEVQESSKTSLERRDFGMITPEAEEPILDTIIVASPALSVASASSFNAYAVPLSPTVSLRQRLPISPDTPVVRTDEEETRQPSIDQPAVELQPDNTEEQPGPGPNAHPDHYLDLDSRNIVDGHRRRQPTTKAADTRDSGRERGVHSAFAAAADAGQQVHRRSLPRAPANYRELANHSERIGFEEVMRQEIHNLHLKGTVEEIAKDQINGQLLPLMWIFTYKFDKHGYLVKYKARLVVRGDLQPASAKDTYAATLAGRSFRLLMAVAAKFDLDAWQCDAVNAFVNSYLDEEVYVEMAPGFAKKNHCWRLLLILMPLARPFCGEAGIVNHPVFYTALHHLID